MPPQMRYARNPTPAKNPFSGRRVGFCRPSSSLFHEKLQRHKFRLGLSALALVVWTYVLGFQSKSIAQGSCLWAKQWRSVIPILRSWCLDAWRSGKQSLRAALWPKMTNVALRKPTKKKQKHKSVSMAYTENGLFVNAAFGSGKSERARPENVFK